MPAAGVVTIIAVVLIVLALVFYLVSTIVELRAITAGLDEVIASVGGDRAEERAGQRRRRATINGHLDAARRRARGPARQEGRPDATPSAWSTACTRGGRAGLRNFPESTDDQGAAHRRGLHQGHAHAGAPRPRGADRHGQPGRPGAAQRRGRQPGRAAALPDRAPDAVRRTCRDPRSSAPTPRCSTSSARTSGSPAGGSRTRRSIVAVYRASGRGPRGALCRLLRHSSTSVRRAWRARSRRSTGSAPRRGSSPAATACCR